MHGIYFRITTALCHLTAVLYICFAKLNGDDDDDDYAEDDLPVERRT